MDLRENGRYALVNTERKEVVAISDNYRILVEFMSHHAYICKECVVREVKKKVFDEMCIRYEGLYLVEMDGVVIRQQDVGTFMKLHDEEVFSIANTIMGIERMKQWGKLKKGEVNKLEGALQVLYKYLDCEKKMLRKSGLTELCSDIYYLDNLKNLQHKDN